METKDIINSIENIHPMAEGMMKSQIDSLREYSQTACIKSANERFVDEKTNRIVHIAKGGVK